jgi:putative ABC transport system permease protein
MQLLFGYFTILGIIISCLGLLGLASFTAEQRRKEIGIRKVLGSTSSGLVVLLSKDYTKWVIISNLIAWPLAWYGMTQWLRNFSYRIEINWWVFLIAGALALAIALLTVSSQAIKAAFDNPIDAIKYE